MSRQQIGFIGAGKMGGAVARRLATGGFPVRVYDPDPAAVEACVRSGAFGAASARDAVKDADVVLTSLPLPEDVLSVWREIAPYLASTAIGVDVSTIDPGTARELSELLGRRTAAFVSCALGKTPMDAEQGRIPLFVGGPADAVAALEAILNRIGEKVHDLGSPEAAATFKLISNMVGMTNLAVLAEGYRLSQRAGIPPDVFTAALDDTGARSFQSELRLPWLIAGDYEARFAVSLAAKDVRLAVDAAARLGVPTPVAAQGMSQFVAAIAHGHGDEDVVAVARVLDPTDGSPDRDADLRDGS